MKKYTVTHLRPQSHSSERLLQAMHVPSRLRKDVTPETLRQAIISACEFSSKQNHKFGLAR